MKRFACLLAAAVSVGMFVTPRAAEACGGCFHQSAGQVQESTVVTGHRMALAISPDETVLWDQIQYAGNPADFAWVLPVKAGAVIEVATDAWFDVLEAGTATVIGSPAISCDGGGFSGGGDSFGCSSSSDGAMMSDGGGFVDPKPPDPVQVLHEGTVGPYDTVTLSTDEPGALNDWLGDNGYAVGDDIQPIIDAYVAEGFDFIALRLSPSQDTRAMKPVRVRTPGASFALPLRMVAAGTGEKTALTLYVIGEGRYELANFRNEQVDMSELIFDMRDNSSNYAELRLDTLAGSDGASWITTSSQRGGLMSARRDPLFLGGNVPYALSNGTTVETLAEAYVRQGQLNGEGNDQSCLGALSTLADSHLKVWISPCGDDPLCVDHSGAPANSIDASELSCGELDDLAVALGGKVIRDVWITRLEANLPRAALANDLVLTAALEQHPVDNRIEANNYVNGPCGDATTASLGLPLQTSRRVPGGLVALTLGGVAAMWWLRRRRDTLV